MYNENVLILIEILLKYIPQGPTNIIAEFVRIMAWLCTGNNPLYEPMMIIFDA